MTTEPPALEQQSTVSLPGPALTWTGRLVLIGAMVAFFSGGRIPPIVPSVAIIAVVVDVILAVVFFRPGSMTASAPGLVPAGDPVQVTLHHEGLRGDAALRMDRAVDAHPIRVGNTGATAVPSTPPHRGPYFALSVAGSLIGPLGLGAAVRRWWVPLPRPLVVAPGRVEATIVADGAEIVDADRSPRRGEEVAEQLREYRPGDSLRRVHWPASERSDALLVRTGDAPARRVHLGIDLGASADQEAETTLAVAHGVAGTWLDEGHAVRVSVMVDRSADEAIEERAAPSRRPNPYFLDRPKEHRRAVGVATVDIVDHAHLGVVLSAAVSHPLPADVVTDLRVDRSSWSPS